MMRARFKELNGKSEAATNISPKQVIGYFLLIEEEGKKVREPLFPSSQMYYKEIGTIRRSELFKRPGIRMLSASFCICLTIICPIMGMTTNCLILSACIAVRSWRHILRVDPCFKCLRQLMTK